LTARTPLPAVSGDESSLVVTVAGWAYGLAFAGVIAGRISHETHLQGLYRDGLKMDADDVGSLWTFYYFWCAACDPLVGITIDALKARGIEATSLLLAATPAWAYLMSKLWAPTSSDYSSLLAVLLPFGLLQATQLMLVSTVLGSVFVAGPKRQAASLARQMLGIVGLLVGMVGPPYLTSDWSEPGVMAGPFVYLAASSVFVGSLILVILRGSLSDAPQIPPPKAAGRGADAGGGHSKGSMTYLLC